MSDIQGKVSILIVDDKPDKLLSIEAVLEDLQQNIIRAYSGRDALRQVLNNELAVILLDVNMPGMDGFETAELIRRRPNSALTPIIFLTAMHDEMYITRGYSLGAVDYILTPVVPQVLRSKVAVFVDLFRKTQQVQRQAERLGDRAKQLHRLAGASLAINSAPSVQKIVQIVTETARDLIGAHQAITLVDPANLPIHRTALASYSDKYAAWRGRTPELEDRALQALVRDRNLPLRMAPRELETHASAMPPGMTACPPLRGLLTAPLSGRDEKSMGIILLSDKPDTDFTDDDQAVLVQLAQMASLAIENTIYADEREANRLKDEFLSTLSHELRTPLNAISGWVQLLRLQSPRVDIEHGLEVIQRNVTAQTRLIEDLLDLSRISTGKLRLNVGPIEIGQVVDAAIEAVRPILRDKGIGLVTHLDEGAGSVIDGDSDRLQQVIWNLLNNAAKFTPSGGTITMRLTRDAGHVHLSVSDTGEGIEPDLLPHVFERFRQADSSSSRNHGGLGIGLTIVQHIVQLLHGSVHATSEGKGKGATFTVILPITKMSSSPEDTDNGDTVDDDPAADQSLPSIRGTRVLVVDDDPDSREVVVEILHRYEAEVASAGSVVEALESFDLQQPDIVVTDLAMPDQDGFALLREVRRRPEDRGGRTPVLALTAYARPEDEDRSLRSGFQGHLAKPIDPAELIYAISRRSIDRDVQAESATLGQHK